LLSSRFPPHMVPPHHSLHTTGIPHPAIVTPNVKQESSHSDISSLNSKQSDAKKEEEKKKQVHIKKPLNAFMLYMKEMRAKVVAECTLKESAAINQILGRRWHALSREEQAKYYELARKERQLHMQLYPGWSARDNYSRSVLYPDINIDQKVSGSDQADEPYFHTENLNIDEHKITYQERKKDQEYLANAAVSFAFDHSRQTAFDMTDCSTSFAGECTRDVLGVVSYFLRSSPVFADAGMRQLCQGKTQQRMLSSMLDPDQYPPSTLSALSSEADIERTEPMPTGKILKILRGW
ncbi:hypothetical protein F2P81_022379, partial [Scophthalmus maximus]